MRMRISCLFILFITIAVFTFMAVACTTTPAMYKVPLSFSVELKNAIGPVGGIRLQITGFSSDLTSGRTQETQRDATPMEILKRLRELRKVFAEAVTDQDGQAHFALTKAGRFTLEINHPASPLDWVLEVEDHAAPVSLKLQWPNTEILMAGRMRGRLSKGLFSSRSVPLRNTALKLHTVAEYKEIASVTSNGQGRFAFPQVPQGLYFLEIIPSPFKTADFYKPEGNIPIYIGSHGGRDSLEISTVNTSCGLFYDLEENKAKYKPEVCFQGGKQVEGKY